MDRIRTILSSYLLPYSSLYFKLAIMNLGGGGNYSDVLKPIIAQFSHQVSDWWRTWENWLYQLLYQFFKPIRIKHLQNEYARKN